MKADSTSPVPRKAMRAVWLALVLGIGASAAARADQIDNFVTAQMSKQHIAGLSIAVLKNGRPVKVKGYGFANLEQGTTATPETVYQIGSVSKQFIATAILLLNREGRVGLDDPISKYLEHAPATWQPITVHQLLTHTSGLVRDAPGMQLKAQSDMDAIRSGYASPLSFKPGDKIEYSNLGYFVLAEIITRAAQKPWPQYIQERIFLPLGMGATRTTTLEDLIPRRSSGYLWEGGQWRNAPDVPGVRPSGAFISTVQDLSRWDAALYSDTLLSPQQLELMWTPVKLNDGSVKNYGFGWEVAKVGSHRLLRHAGTMLGFRAEFSRYVDDHLTVVVLTNSGQALAEKVAGGVAALYIHDLQPRRHAAKLSAAALDAYTGKYQLANGVLNVTRRGDNLALTMDLGWRKIEMAVLTPESRTRFFDEDNPRPTFFFEADGQGRTQFVMRNEDGKEGVKGSKLD